MGHCVSKQKSLKNEKQLELIEELNSISDSIRLQVSIDKFCHCYTTNIFYLYTTQKQISNEQTSFIGICYHDSLKSLSKSDITTNLLNSNKISSFELNDHGNKTKNIQHFQSIQKLLQSWVNLQEISLNFLYLKKKQSKIGDKEMVQFTSTLIKCQKLHSLNLNFMGYRIQDEGISNLGHALIECKQLQNLQLSISENECQFKALNSLAKAILQCEKLQVLKLCQILSQCLIEEALNSQLVLNCVHYQDIQFKFDGFYDKKSNRVIGSLDLSKLNMLLNNCSLLSELSLIFINLYQEKENENLFLENCANLKVLNIKLQIKRKDLIFLDYSPYFEMLLKKCQNIQSLNLDLYYQKLSNEQLSKICLTFASITKLKNLTLNLIKNEISCFGAKDLAAFLRKYDFLYVLKILLLKNYIKDQSSVSFQQSVLKMKRLVQFDIKF
ncbi:hypothetical protein TTHERM_01568160 (macronuclear) [Tetrahymena thermophila SB210]|uniref:Kinase domain protein n=1 Tax=Tetrahymena thermophila (strain SB210) TaxID=312017 RepID=Q228I4_TETTS|nr:hypothetical protein TTHERM_01568160 [Tetrahymena thermophila SB210]EAR81702.2 hypothetical protein TTHERM_01568160 [Tetrahymena thermophila SB210]|eukprot:XP_001029365.2 hypothetical protein TTHERM_01568160 [Tetrahymena thermophila SB210]